MNWLIRKDIETNKYQVGYFEPNGDWVYILEYDTLNKAVLYIHYLNGGEK